MYNGGRIGQNSTYFGSCQCEPSRSRVGVLVTTSAEESLFVASVVERDTFCDVDGLGAPPIVPEVVSVRDGDLIGFFASLSMLAPSACGRILLLHSITDLHNPS